MYYSDYDQKYATLILKKCFVNDGKKTLVIRIKYEDQEPFAKVVSDKAKELGFKEVYIFNCKYEKLREYLRNTDIDNIKIKAEFDRSIAVDFAKRGANFLYLESEKHDFFTIEDNKKLDKFYELIDDQLKEYYERIDSLKCPWTIVCYPNKEWAKKVYPNLSIDKAYENLYLNIMKMCLIDKKNPLKEWDKIQKKYSLISEKLNELKIQRLHYKNNMGTDLTMCLPKNHLWLTSGDDKDFYGNKIMVNLPSYEIFTAPIYNSTNGIVYSTKPLFYKKIIQKFGLEFKNGEVKNIITDSVEDYKILESLLKEDQGSRFLGECALVESKTPVGKTNSLYFEPLYDENSSSHLALGNCYSESIVGGIKMSDKDLKSNGLNISNTHVDFMIGSHDLKVEADTYKGKKLIFAKGKFKI